MTATIKPELTQDDYTKIWMDHVSPFLLSPEDKTYAHELMGRRVRIGDALNLVDIPLNTLQNNYSRIATELDVARKAIEKLGVSEADWEDLKRESLVETEEQNKQMQENILKMAKENAAKAGATPSTTSNS